MNDVSCIARYLSRIKPCSFSYYVLKCDQGPVIMVFILAIVLSLPFGYVAFSIMRAASFIRNKKYIPGLAYIISYLVYLYMIILARFFFYRDFHYLDYDLYFRLYFIGIDLYNYSSAHYFVAICKILCAFGTKGSKIMYYISIVLKYFLLGAFFFRLSLVYIPISEKFMKTIFIEAGSYVRFFEIIKKVIWCLSIIILSICFIFSSINQFIPLELRKKMKRALFCLPLGMIISIIATVIQESEIFYSSQIIVSQQYWYLLSFIIADYTCEICILYIISILSVNEWTNESEEHSSDINLTLEI